MYHTGPISLSLTAGTKYRMQNDFAMVTLRVKTGVIEDEHLLSSTNKIMNGSY